MLNALKQMLLTGGGALFRPCNFLIDRMFRMLELCFWRPRVLNEIRAVIIEPVFRHFGFGYVRAIRLEHKTISQQIMTIFQ